MNEVAPLRRLIVVSLMVVISACGSQQTSLSTTGSSSRLDGQGRVEPEESARHLRRRAGAAMDVHTHVMSSELAAILAGPGAPASTADDLIDRLDAAHVRQAVVLSLAYFSALPDDAAVRAENDYTAAEVRKYPDRLIGFCGVNPLRASALDEIDRCVDDLGMRGIKLHLPASGVDLKLQAHVAAVSAVFDRAGERDLPVLMHSGFPPGLPLDSDALANLGSVIATHPEVRLVLAHCTNDSDRDEMEIWLAGLDQGVFNNESLFVDTSSCLNFYKDAPKAQKELMVWRLRKWGIERVFFASDYLMVAPDATPAEALEIIRSYPFTRTELSTILNNDASTWLTG
jgi:predicted TIM-barrel fold metal-dependent hydrolase